MNFFNQSPTPFIFLKMITNLSLHGHVVSSFNSFIQCCCLLLFHKSLVFLKRSFRLIYFFQNVCQGFMVLTVCLTVQCDKVSGECICPDVTTAGKDCNQPCPTQCDSKGCYQNFKCRKCKEGFYGEICNLQCPVNCRVNNKYGCYQSGDCESCASGFRGFGCSSPCPLSCKGPCDKETAICSCKPGYKPTGACNEGMQTCY